MLKKDMQSAKDDTCPVCGGAGKIEEVYAFKPRHRYDVMGESQLHAEPCWLCGGQPVTREMLDEWQTLQRYPVCPSCGGTGGKRWWTWGETEGEPEQVFTYTPCKLCGGKQHVSPEVKQDYERQRRIIQFGTLFVVLVVGFFGLWGATALVSVVLRQTPAIFCCPLPQFVVPGAALLGIITVRGIL